MRMRVPTTKLRVEIENEMRVFLESLNFEIEMRVSQKSAFFPVKPTSKSFNDPLKVLTEGSMVEYLPVGSQEAPQTIFGKKKFPASKS